MENRDRLFTLMLAGAVVGTILLASLVAADLSRGHVQGTQVAQIIGPTTGNEVTGPGGTTGSLSATPTATPGAQGAAVNGPTATGPQAPRRGTAPKGGSPTIACANCGVVGSALLIGSIITVTGPGRSIPMADAVASWVQDVNRRGGINGHTIKLDARDDGGNADTGAAEYHDFAEGEKVLAVLSECAPITDEQEIGYVNQQQLLLVGECQSASEAYRCPDRSSCPANASPYIWVTGPTPYENGEIGAKMMVTGQGWKGTVAELCLNDPSTLNVCQGAADEYKKLGITLEGGGPHYEDITGNDYAAVIGRYQSEGITQVHLSLEPGNAQRWLNAADAAGYNPKTFMALVIDDSIAAHANANGMMIDTPWTPLDQNTAQMSRLRDVMGTYYPDVRVDLYAQTGWANCLLLEQALQLMGPNVSKQNLIDTLNVVQNFPDLGEVENYSPNNHTGTPEDSLMQLQGAGSDQWHFVTLHGAIGL